MTPTASRRLKTALFFMAGLFVCAGCRRLESPATQPTSRAKNQSEAGTVVTLFSDARMPFQRAQAQYLNVLDAQDPQYALILKDAQGDPGVQLSQMEALTAAPPSALMLLPADLTLLTEVLTQLKKAGTRIFIIDPATDIEPHSAPAEAIIACDPFKIGVTAAKLTLQALARRAEALNRGVIEGRVLELRGSDDSPWCSRVHDGFVEGLRAQPAVLIVHDTPADWTPGLVPARLSEAIRLQQSIDVIFAHDDFLAQAAHETASQSGIREDTLIIGVNGFSGNEGGLEMMRKNQIDATILRPFLVDHAWSLLSKSPSPEFATKIAFPPKTILPADLDHPDRLTLPLPESETTH